MARSAAETERKAREAFLELHRQGEKVTTAKVRMLIGGGGTDVINRVINEMNVKIRTQMFELANRPGVPAELVDLIMHVWGEANRMADGRFVTAHAEAQQQIDAANAAKEAALAHGADLEKRVDALEENLASKTGEAAALRTGIETAEGRVADLERTVAARTEEADRARRDAEARVRAAEERTAEQERLAEERYRGLEHRLLENFDRERTQLARDIERLKSEGIALVAQRDGLLAELKTASAAVLRQKDECATLAADLAETKGRLAAMIDERERAEKRGGKLRKFAARSRTSKR